ncbi:MAG: ABC transporter permease [Deltaproteobacteria bacterium]|nr:ABC transporter permease [Deltaproteobacteria bacterium]
MTDPSAFLPILGVIVATILAGILLNLGIWFIVIRFFKGLASRIGVHVYLAVRQLGGKRSGYVSATALVAMWGISASSCNLITTLSVMGGFGEDLKSKILGTKSHVVIDSPGGEVLEYEQIIEGISSIEGVVGVAPYIQGEVMVRSAVNISGAVLRGIDPALAGRVTSLDETIEKGSLQYLVEPDRIMKDGVFGKRWKPVVVDEQEGNEPGAGRAPPGQAPPREPSREDGPSDRPRSLTEVLDEAVRVVESDDGDAGRRPGVTPPTLPGVIVGREMVKNLSLYLGDEVKLISPLGELGPTGPMPKSRTYRVAAVFFSGMYEYDAKNVYVTLESSRRFLGIEKGVTGLEVKVRDPDRVEAVTARIEEIIRPLDLRVRHWKELNRSLFSALLLEKIGMFIMLSVIVVIAYLIIVTTLFMMVMEKTRDIAVLKTLGCSEWSIYRIFQIEGLILGLSGTFIGVTLGVAQTLGLKYFGVPLDPDVHYINQLPVQIDVWEVTIVAVASLVICLLITILPAYRASRLTVVDGLRFK